MIYDFTEEIKNARKKKRKRIYRIIRELILTSYLPDEKLGLICATDIKSTIKKIRGG